MPGAPTHPWDVSPQEAIAIQRRLCGRVSTRNRFRKVRYVAGIDVGFESGGTVTRAAVAVLRFPELEPWEHAVARRPTQFPYVPGLLSFREIPAVLDALGRLRTMPDLTLCDAHGYAHPRRFGLACHLGVIADLAVIGVAKSRLTGAYAADPVQRGEWVPLEAAGEVIGAVLCTRTGTRPVYVSVGHRIDLTTAIEYTLACAPRYRLPETTRRAHRLASG